MSQTGWRRNPWSRSRRSDPMTPDNSPDLWGNALPRPARDAHKYHRGHLVILGAERFTGATRLAAESGSRIGAGLVTVLSSSQAETYYATLPADIMVAETTLSEVRKPTVLLAGPGGCTDSQAQAVLDADPAISRVLDADAIRLHNDLPPISTIFTPHAGEFERYFGPITSDKSGRALQIAAKTQAVMVLKGPETIIAGPDGRAVRNTTASPYLAKAGTGDVLAGMIAGLTAQGMPIFDAACAGVWLHGRAAQKVGPGLIPQDLIAELPVLLRDVLA
ncbi:MAG: NAD(P)H-hydrate dehydratase [Pseudomonadota bacterium]